MGIMGIVGNIIGGLVHFVILGAFAFTGGMCLINESTYAKVINGDANNTKFFDDASIMMKSEFRHVGSIYTILVVIGVLALLQRFVGLFKSWYNMWKVYLMAAIYLLAAICLSRVISFIKSGFVAQEVYVFISEVVLLTWCDLELMWMLQAESKTSDSYKGAASTELKATDNEDPLK